MPVFEMVPGQSPEAPGVLQFFEQGADPSTGFSVTSKGAISAPGGTSAPVKATLAATTTDVLTSKVTGDSAVRLEITADGTVKWGGGSGAADCVLDRYAAGGLELNCALRFTNGQLLFGPAGDVDLYWGGSGVLKTDNNLTVNGSGGVTIGTAGAGLKVKTGSNATAGTQVLTAGSAVVSTTKVTASSIIFLTNQVNGGTAGFVRVSARTAGTSFTITSASGTDTSTIGWFIVEPAP